VAERYCSRPLEDWDVDHYHFFSSGFFGSEDQHGKQVDDRNYKVRGTHTLLIGRSRFRYTVRGDTLTLDPVITATMRDEAVAKPGKSNDAVWMVSVAVTGTSWNRVECAWCWIADQSMPWSIVRSPHATVTDGYVERTGHTERHIPAAALSPGRSRCRRPCRLAGHARID
jgi:hypothetical protein